MPLQHGSRRNDKSRKDDQDAVTDRPPPSLDRVHPGVATIASFGTSCGRVSITLIVELRAYLGCWAVGLLGACEYFPMKRKGMDTTCLYSIKSDETRRQIVKPANMENEALFFAGIPSCNP